MNIFLSSFAVIYIFQSYIPKRSEENFTRNTVVYVTRHIYFDLLKFILKFSSEKMFWNIA